MSLPYRKNASIIAQKKSKFLFVKKPRIHHAWQFPQGGVEHGETFFQAALREFIEELGTDKIKIYGQEVGIFYYDWPSEIEISENLKKFRGQEVHFFRADFFGTESDINLDYNELEKWQWVTKNELADLIESPEYLAKIQKII
jgi:putative (di)nucleoside polyphosphate hydrolase